MIREMYWCDGELAHRRAADASPQTGFQFAPDNSVLSGAVGVLHHPIAGRCSWGVYAPISRWTPPAAVLTPSARVGWTWMACASWV